MTSIAPAFLSTLFLIASKNIAKIEPNIAYKPVVVASSPDIACGKKNRPIPMEKEASKRQLPIMFPMESSYCFFRRAVIVTTNSGSDVPIATTKKLIKYSEILKLAESEITDCTTI